LHESLICSATQILCEHFDAEAAKLLRAEVQRLDPEGQRPISAAVNLLNETSAFYDQLDLVGINYNIDWYKGFHEIFPAKPIIGRWVVVQPPFQASQLPQAKACLVPRAVRLPVRCRTAGCTRRT
jgi:hypothetical protein